MTQKEIKLPESIENRSIVVELPESGRQWDFEEASLSRDILILTGPPRSGKSRIAKFVASIFDPSDVGCININRLASEFVLRDLVGKKLVVCDDCDPTVFGSDKKLEHMLLQITSRTPMRISRQCQEDTTEVINCKFILILTDTSNDNDPK